MGFPRLAVRRRSRPGGATPAVSLSAKRQIDGQVLLIRALTGWPSAMLADSLNGLDPLALPIGTGLPPRNGRWLR